MKASLIFSSTSHSINVQKVRKQVLVVRVKLTPADLQDCSVESVRPEVHDSRDREHWRASPPLPGRLVAGAVCVARTESTTKA
jgi:hypothetical protein